MKKKAAKLDKPLTEVELELMNIVWDLAECTVKDVQTALAARRELAYTSVATMMKILEQKGALGSEKANGKHVYRPLLSRDDYGGASLRHLADHVFQGSPSTMVLRLLDDSKLSQDELATIRRLLEEKLQ
jgi:predicted transcriptional regulator